MGTGERKQLCGGGGGGGGARLHRFPVNQAEPAPPGAPSPTQGLCPPATLPLGSAPPFPAPPEGRREGGMSGRRQPPPHK